MDLHPDEPVGWSRQYGRLHKTVAVDTANASTRKYRDTGCASEIKERCRTTQAQRPPRPA